MEITISQSTTQTTRQRFEQMLFERGVFENQAKAIMDYAIPKLNEQAEKMEIAHKFDWNGRADGYPDMVYSVVFNLNLKPFVVEWIDANIPAAGFRSMFV